MLISSPCLLPIAWFPFDSRRFQDWRWLALKAIKLGLRAFLKESLPFFHYQTNQLAEKIMTLVSSALVLPASCVYLATKCKCLISWLGSITFRMVCKLPQNMFKLLSISPLLSMKQTLDRTNLNQGDTWTDLERLRDKLRVWENIRKKNNQGGKQQDGHVQCFAYGRGNYSDFFSLWLQLYAMIMCLTKYIY